MLRNICGVRLRESSDIAVLNVLCGIKKKGCPSFKLKSSLPTERSDPPASLALVNVS